ncbi:MAG: DUF2309 domain-containing protein [Gammaproteobacteria bacterium]|nr:DUF2309 domain-containing protein [Gammaproteobacteria bacterium]
MKTLNRDFKENSMQAHWDVKGSSFEYLKKNIKDVWDIIPPVWPLENIIACNPLQGLESFSFEEACVIGSNYFQKSDLPETLLSVNRETIKWCQAFFDQGQATFSMPGRAKGLYKAWLELALYDENLHQNVPYKIQILKGLSENPRDAIFYVLMVLNIPESLSKEFLTILLTSLPGWSGYVKYQVEWATNNLNAQYPLSEDDFLAIRLVTFVLLCPNVKDFINHIKINSSDIASINERTRLMKSREEKYLSSLLPLLRSQMSSDELRSIKKSAEVQLVFCIDVRSEPFRRAIEKEGNYETLGFAGFFGLPIRIRKISSDEFDSCPVLLDSQHIIQEELSCSDKQCHKFHRGENIIKNIKRIYYGLKYSFSTHFGLVETIGLWSGVWMMIKTLSPKMASILKNSLIRLLKPQVAIDPIIEKTAVLSSENPGIEFSEQCQYAANSLAMMGLTQYFAPIVAFCGHGSTTQNNAFATALDCGACGGHHGGFNAKILAKILNDSRVREWLSQNTEIKIPVETVFIAAQHDTTTDAMELYLQNNVEEKIRNKLAKLKQDLDMARIKNNVIRAQELGYFCKSKNALDHCTLRSQDWAQTRPEWGLSRNACFIVGPRNLTKNIILEGRSFLHSYDWRQDPEGKFLEIILTAPMVVAQWINAQYLFSTMDNIAYGSGSKITQNITGKIGVMQGNASDLMHGLPLQSVYKDDQTQYHEPMRLLTVVYAPKDRVSQIIKRQPCLQKLFGNGWVNLAILDPNDQSIGILQRDFSWKDFQ